MKPEDVQRFFPTEAALCDLFIREFNEQPGWTCYPETGGFDIMVAHDSGRQIGVEAKLRLNAKVADQIVPSDAWHRYCQEGPDHRLVIVASITEANAGIAKMLQQFGIPVWAPRAVDEWISSSREHVRAAHFEIARELANDGDAGDAPKWLGYHASSAWFDWNPQKRIVLPDVPPTVAAGVPGPVQLTPWKQAALRVLARLRVQGYITAKEIASEGCSPSNWTQRWLKQGAKRGQWVETSALPRFDLQHPENYASAYEKAQASLKEAA